MVIIAISARGYDGPSSAPRCSYQLFHPPCIALIRNAVPKRQVCSATDVSKERAKVHRGHVGTHKPAYTQNIPKYVTNRRKREKADCNNDHHDYQQCSQQSTTVDVFAVVVFSAVCCDQVHSPYSSASLPRKVSLLKWATVEVDGTWLLSKRNLVCVAFARILAKLMTHSV